jgi:hypothetical protein
MGSEPDGSLHDWDDIASMYAWDTLLLGNGLSINIWEPFKYRALYDHARAGGVLTAQDRALFESTPNFERVLGDLNTAIRVNECVGVDCGPLYERYRNIQLALGHAVREVHLNRDRVPLETRQLIRRVVYGLPPEMTFGSRDAVPAVTCKAGPVAPLVELGGDAGALAPPRAVRRLRVTPSTVPGRARRPNSARPNAISPYTKPHFHSLLGPVPAMRS